MSSPSGASRAATFGTRCMTPISWLPSVLHYYDGVGSCPAPTLSLHLHRPRFFGHCAASCVHMLYGPSGYLQQDHAAWIRPEPGRNRVSCFDGPWRHRPSSCQARAIPRTVGRYRVQSTLINCARLYSSVQTAASMLLSDTPGFFFFLRGVARGKLTNCCAAWKSPAPAQKHSVVQSTLHTKPFACCAASAQVCPVGAGVSNGLEGSRGAGCRCMLCAATIPLRSVLICQKRGRRCFHTELHCSPRRVHILTN